MVKRSHTPAEAPADLQAQPLAAATGTAVSAMNLATALHAAPADAGSAPAPRGHTNATASDAPAVKVETPEPARASKIGRSIAQDKPGKKSSRPEMRQITPRQGGVGRLPSRGFGKRSSVIWPKPARPEFDEEGNKIDYARKPRVQRQKGLPPTRQSARGKQGEALP